jgi:hypothetical protein
MPAVGSQSPQAKSGGVWKSWSNFWGRHNNTWKKPLSVHVKSGGNWVKVWDERPVATSISRTSSDAYDFEGIYLYTEKIVSFSLASNGFATSITVSNGTVTPTSVAANGTASVTATWITDFTSGFQTVTCTNASGSVTV